MNMENIDNKNNNDDVDFLKNIDLDLLMENPYEVKMEILNDNVGFITDIGVLKKENQDFAIVGERDDGLKIMIVADGVTSSQFSAESSKYSCEYLLNHLNKKNSFSRNYIIKVIQNLNKEIIRKQKSKKLKNAYLSTVVLALIKKREVILAWLGDSRAYFVNEQEGILLTKDDSYVNALIDRGELTIEDSINHPKKHVITQCLGLEENKQRGFILNIHTKTFKIPDSYNLLLCTDGLWGVVDLNKGVKLKKHIDGSLIKMIKEANKAGGHDNITCALYQP